MAPISGRGDGLAAGPLAERWGSVRLVGEIPSGQHRRKPPPLIAHGCLHRCTPPGSIEWSKRRQVSWLAARRLDPPSRAIVGPVARNRIAARRLQLRGQRRTGAKARAGFPFKSRRTPSAASLSCGPGAGKGALTAALGFGRARRGIRSCILRTAAAVGFVSRLPCRMAARVRSCGGAEIVRATTAT